jgi:hypothetical protein
MSNTAGAGHDRLRVRLLIFQPGPHGITALAVTRQANGLTPPVPVDLAAAGGLAISGVPVFIHRFLLPQEASRARLIIDERTADG